MKFNTPLAKSSNLVVQDLPNEVLVYDLKNNKAICLNSSAATIWKYCDGKTNVDQMVKLFNDETNLSIKVDLIRLALDELSKFELIENYSLKYSNQVSRRQAINNMIIPLTLLPVVTGIIAPPAIHAASSICEESLIRQIQTSNPPSACSTNADCASQPFDPCREGYICSAPYCSSLGGGCCQRDVTRP